MEKQPKARQIYVRFGYDELDALRILADRDLRGIQEEVRWLIRGVLQREGLIPITPYARDENTDPEE